MADTIGVKVNVYRHGNMSYDLYTLGGPRYWRLPYGSSNFSDYVLGNFDDIVASNGSPVLFCQVKNKDGSTLCNLPIYKVQSRVEYGSTGDIHQIRINGGSYKRIEFGSKPGSSGYGGTLFSLSELFVTQQLISLDVSIHWGSFEKASNVKTTIILYYLGRDIVTGKYAVNRLLKESTDWVIPSILPVNYGQADLVKSFDFTGQTNLNQLLGCNIKAEIV